jgi:stachyose synthetase
MLQFGGVIGAFNCQGAGWDPVERRIRGYAHCYKRICGTVQPADVEWGQRDDTAAMANAAEYAVYKHHSEELVLMARESDPIHFTLEPSSYEIFTFAPVMQLAGGSKFAPVGVVDLLNCGGTVVDVEGHGDVRVRVKGAGKLMVYSSVRPEKIMVDGLEAVFEWGDGGKLEVAVSWDQDKEGVSDVVFCY